MESIARYMTELDRADREPALVTEARVEHIKQKVETVKKQMRELKQIGKKMSQAPDGQISLTDPDARSMATRVVEQVWSAITCKRPWTRSIT